MINKKTIIVFTVVVLVILIIVAVTQTNLLNTGLYRSAAEGEIDPNWPTAEYGYRTKQGQSPAYISSDIASRLFFIASDPKMPLEPHGIYWIHMVVPEDMMPVGAAMRRRTLPAPPEDIQDLGAVTRDGQNYHYYKIKIPHSSYRMEFFVYMDTTLAVGTETNMYYWGSSVQPGSDVEVATPERTLPVEVISVHRIVNKPERLLIGQGWESLSTYTAWPNFGEEFSGSGANIILLTEPFTNDNTKEAIEEFVENANNAGIYVGAAIAPGKLMQPAIEGKPEIQAHMADGTVWSNSSGKGTVSICYRGEEFDQALLQPLRDIASGGVSFVAFDWEWGFKGIDFSPWCIDRFATFLAEKYPELEYMDPREFEPVPLPWNDPPPYPEYREAWNDFLSDMIAEWFGLQKAAFEEAVAQYGANSSPGVKIGDYGGPPPLRRAHEVLFYQPKNLQTGLDYVMPTAYRPSDPTVIRSKAEAIRRGDGYRDFAYPADSLIYWTTFGWTSGGQMVNPAVARYTLLEILANGSTGFVIYDGSGMDVRAFDTVSKIIDAVAPHEDIIIDGEHIILESNDELAVVHGQKLGDHMVILAGEYDTSGVPEGELEKDVTVTVPVTVESTMYNLETGEYMGILTPEENTFTVTFFHNRAVLVHISPSDGSPPPIQTPTPTPTHTPIATPCGGGVTPCLSLAPSPTPTHTPTTSCTLSDYGLTEGQVISSIFFEPTDFDIYIPNDHCYKRLFLNQIIYSFYGHLNYTEVINVTPDTRDRLPTSGIFRNCEANTQEVYGVEVTGEDTGLLHHISLTGSEAVSQDPDFFKTVFCINNNEFNWYTNNGTTFGVPYTHLNQIPVYVR